MNATSGPAARLVDQIRTDLAPINSQLTGHPYPAAIAAGDIPTDALEQFAHEQYWIISSDRRSFAHLAARHAGSPGGALFLTLAQSEGIALEHLVEFARWLGIDPDELHQAQPTPAAHAYTAYVAWLALNGSATDVTAAFLVNMPAWGSNCAKTAQALRSRYDADDAAVGFFDFFAAPAPGFEDDALAIIDHGLRNGDSPSRAAAAARLLQAYELMFWDAMATAGHR